MQTTKVMFVSLFLAIFLPSAVEASQVFTYELPMINVDTVKNARRFPGKRASIIGFEGSWSATKRFPFKLGPGEVRVYMRQYPDNDRKVLVTIGDQTQKVIIRKTDFRNNWPELKFNLKEASDQVKFETETLDGKKGRIIWYTTIFTNDPDYKYKTFYQHGIKSDKYKYHSLGYENKTAYQNKEGNLLPNSGFEEGIRGWDIQPYRSNEMAKPSLLSAKAAHGKYSLDTGKVKIISRPFFLKGDKDYTFSIYTAEDNSKATELTLEVSGADGGIFKKFKKFKVEKAESSDVKGWNRSKFSFRTLPDEKTTKGLYRLSFTKPAGAPLKKPLLVDSLQIVEGDNKSYEPHLGLEANFIPPNTQSIFDLNAPVKVIFNLEKAPDVKIKKCAYTVYDYYDRKIGNEKQIDIKGDSFKKEIPLDTSRAGFYRILTKIEYSRKGKLYPKVNEYFYNVIKPVKPRTDIRERSLLGAYFYKAPAPVFGYLETAKKFGFTEFNPLGHQFIRWRQNISKDSKPGNIKYDWTNSDKEVDRFIADGIKPVAQLHLTGTGGYGIPQLCLYKGADTPKSKDDFDKQSEFLTVGTRHGKQAKVNIKLWNDYVKQFVRHFKGRVSKYVIEDEPAHYFSPEEYAKFYLATRKAIKSVDPDIPVFFDGFIASDMKLINALNKATNNKAHEYIDGIHVYLDSQHSGKISKYAAREFRDYIKKYNIPLVTVTCYNNAYSHDSDEIKDSPDFAQERNGEVNTVQQLFDGIVWGGSNCRYFYYGAFPGKNRGIYIFDETGRIKPVFHFYSAANNLLGGHKGAESIDDFTQFRIGLVKKDKNKGIGVIYSVNGRIYDISLDADGITEVMDGFGNTVKNWKRNGKLNYHVSAYPLYFKVDDLAVVKKNLKKMKFEDKFPIALDVEKYQSDLLGIRVVIKSKTPVSMKTTVNNPVNINKKLNLETVKISNGKYLLKIPFRESAYKACDEMLPLTFETEYGPITGKYSLRYAPIFVNKESNQKLNVHGYRIRKDGSHSPLNVGALSFTLGKEKLNIKYTEFFLHRIANLKFTLIPVNSKNEELLKDKKICFEVKDGKGIIQNKNTDNSFPVTVTQKPYSISMSLPLSKIPGFITAPGAVYACDVKAPYVKDDVPFSTNIYYDEKNLKKVINPDQWSRLMIVE